jgi:outer membrane protein assembly factor BamB
VASEINRKRAEAVLLNERSKLFPLVPAFTVIVEQQDSRRAIRQKVRIVGGRDANIVGGLEADDASVRGKRCRLEENGAEDENEVFHERPDDNTRVVVAIEFSWADPAVVYKIQSNSEIKEMAMDRIKNLRSIIVGLLSLVWLVSGLRSARADWPSFRGPWGDGHVTAPDDIKTVGLPLSWSETNNVKWKTEIPYRGWSTPVVMGGQIWLTTATADGHDFFAICADAETGKIQFNEKLFHCETPEPLGNSVNCYAAPSPAIELGRVYVHFGSYGTACLDTRTGKVLWQRQDLLCRHYRGPASSVILFENLVILTMDGADVQYLVALDKLTGKTVWKTNRSVAWNDENSTSRFAKDGDLRKAHSTPLIVEVGGQPQMISAGAKAAYAYDPRNGRELWRVQCPDAWSAAPMPVFSRGLAMFVTGLGKTELYAVRTDGRGDVSGSHIAWKFAKSVAKTSSPVLVDDLLYMVSDDSTATCLEIATGQPVWKERLGGNFAASPIYADGRLYFTNQQGKTTVLKPGRTFEVVATNILENGCMASPSVSGKALFLRTKTHLYRIESVSK